MQHVYDNEGTIKAYFAGVPNVHNRHRSVYSTTSVPSVSRVKENILFSYGAHFPLAVERTSESNLKDGTKWYLLSGDKRSDTTSHHQSMVHSYALNEPNISFSALKAAGLDYKTVLLVDYWPDAYAEIRRHAWNEETGEYDIDNTPSDAWIHFKEWMPVGATYFEETKDGQVIRKSWHRIGSVLLQDPVKGDKYLCSMDEGSYFISLLSSGFGEHIRTVQDAFEVLKPVAVRHAEAEGLTVLRQGEWFFIPTGKTYKELNVRLKDFQHSQHLPRKRKDAYGNERGNRHMPTRMLSSVSGMYVYGRVRHWQENRDSRSGEHRQVVLPGICMAYENTAVESWSASGKVD